MQNCTSAQWEERCKVVTEWQGLRASRWKNECSQKDAHQGQSISTVGTCSPAWHKTKQLMPIQMCPLQGPCRIRAFRVHFGPLVVKRASQDTGKICGSLTHVWVSLQGVRMKRRTLWEWRFSCFCQDAAEGTSLRKLRKRKLIRRRGKAILEKDGLALGRAQGSVTHQGPSPSNKEHGKILSARPSNLFTQQRLHRPQELHRCADCGRGFGVFSNLIRHPRANVGEKPHECPDCGKGFGHSSALVTHGRIHTGGKPYACNECGRRFNVVSNLLRHERSHTGEKPYQCPDCGRGCSQRAHLVTHLRLHTGERPYRCPECGESFNVSSDLIKHRRIHTGKKLYICPECGKSFAISSK
ncbi:uncharacterized protein LOC143831631 [Paroedura picta]|uniref:uncharacterized protein LOC143831631 n=1 Tax=Paroedura picta TaxID=143630 RepID=UPI0040565428